MRWSSGITYVGALLGLGSNGLAQTVVVKDATTGFTFTEYRAQWATGNNYINYRIAIPSGASGAYDMVFQVIAPTAVGWAGLALGGTMTNNPLIVGWANGASATVSVRRATSHVAPTVYTAASLQTLPAGTKTNGTHWQYTAKCAGCSSFTGSGGTNKTLNPAGSNRLAFASSRSRVTTPSSPNSAINVHDAFNYWDHDFASAQNLNFAALVTQNA